MFIGTGPPSLEALCRSFWLRTLTKQTQRGDVKSDSTWLSNWRHYLSRLPSTLRQRILHEWLELCGDGGNRGRGRCSRYDDIDSCALAVLLDSTMVLSHCIYISLPADDMRLPASLSMVMQNASALRRLVVYVRNGRGQILDALLRQCPRLIHLQLIGASDNCLSVIASRCTQLQHLLVSGENPEEKVTDQGLVDMVQRLAGSYHQPCLESIILNRTHITEIGIRYLLHCLPSTKHVDHPSVQNILLEYPQDGRPLSLQRLPELEANVQQIQRLSTTCPLVTKISLEMHRACSCVTTVSSFTRLQHLSLRLEKDFDVRACDLRQLLMSLSERLTALELSGHIPDWLQVFRYSLSCVHLEVLKLSTTSSQAESSAFASASWWSVDAHVPVPTSLQILECIRPFFPESINTQGNQRDVAAFKRVLANTPRVRFVKITPFPLHDDDMESILEQNTLQYLEVFDVAPTLLSERSALAIISTCPALRQLGHLSQWRHLCISQLSAVRLWGRIRSSDVRPVVF